MQQGSSQESCGRRETRAPRRALVASVFPLVLLACGRGGRRVWRCLVRPVAIYPSECRPGLQRTRGHHCCALEDLLDAAGRSRPAVSDSRRRRLRTHRLFTVGVPGRRDAVRRRQGVLLSVRRARPLRDVQPGPPHPVGARPLRLVLGGDRQGRRRGADARPWTSFFHSGNQLVTVNITDQVALAGPVQLPAELHPGDVVDQRALRVGFRARRCQLFAARSHHRRVSPRLPAHRRRHLLRRRSARFPATPGRRSWPRRASRRVPEVVTLHQTFVPPVDPVAGHLPDRPRPRHPASRSLRVGDPEDRVAGRRVHGYMGNARRAGDEAADREPGRSTRTGPTVRANCMQQNGRRCPRARMADAVMQAVTSYPEQYQQFHFLVFRQPRSRRCRGRSIDSLSAFFSALQYGARRRTSCGRSPGCSTPGWRRPTPRPRPGR